MTTDCTTEPRRTNPIDARLTALLRSVSSMSALFVGALTVVLSREIMELLPLSQFYQSLALLPITIALLYVLLALAGRLEGGEP
ncbi:hypothetical protein BRC80_00520 [Halobacteriales archaeon QH_9_66_26]|nr:MAG: hypothetical protein BRC80_00520 [Halobacteriales archaeon QH_9_66_26]